MRTLSTLAMLVTLVVSAALVNAMPASEGGPTGAFSLSSLDKWSERSFDGNTHYELVEQDGIAVLKGHTKGQASILYREETIDLLQTPLIQWSWKVDRSYMNIDEQSREGDDFPARLYVVAQIGFLPWETLAINYVWASETPLDEAWASPYTEKAHMVAVQSGDNQVGSWVVQSRNVAKDFKTFFDADIEEINGYAVMVDGDNTGLEAIAWFGQIAFSAP